MVLTLLAAAAPAQLPQRDLTVELRQIEDSAGFAVGTRSDAADMHAQWVRVLNGEKATLQTQQSVPFQWVQSVAAQSATFAASGASAASRSGAVTQALTWMDAGQTLSVQPSWPGGNADVTLVIEARATSLQGANGSGLPAQDRRGVSTTLKIALGQWVTLARSGAAQAARGSYGTDDTSAPARLLQVRVLAP